MTSPLERIGESPLAGAFVVALAAAAGQAGSQFALDGEFVPLVALPVAISAFVVAYVLLRAAP